MGFIRTRSNELGQARKTFDSFQAALGRYGLDDINSLYSADFMDWQLPKTGEDVQLK